VSGLRRVVRRFWPQIRPQGLLIAGSLVALLLETAARLLEPWPLKFVLDEVIAGQRASGGSTGCRPARCWR
jgi:ATP-binding cassette, subfamily B, bacterial